MPLWNPNRNSIEPSQEPLSPSALNPQRNAQTLEGTPAAQTKEALTL